VLVLIVFNVLGVLGVFLSLQFFYVLAYN